MDLKRLSHKTAVIQENVKTGEILFGEIILKSSIIPGMRKFTDIILKPPNFVSLSGVELGDVRLYV